MSEPERSGPLAGLIGRPAEAAYQRLCAVGSVRAEEFDGAGAELLDLGVAFRSGDDDELVRPVAPSAALRMLLDCRQRELMSMQRTILDGWERLTSVGSAVVGAAGLDGVDGVRLLTDFGEIVTRAAELYPSAKRRLRGVETGAFPTRPSASRVRTPPPAAVCAGVRFQMMYQADYLETAAGSKIIDRSLAAGEEIRLRSMVPTKMLHVDDSVALVALDRTARSALLIRAPALLAVLADWFDVLWDAPTTMRYPIGAQDPPLRADQLQVLKLMPVNDDKTIARKLRVSVTTVRRHVKAIYEVLEVNNRFAAGMAAAKRDWI